jgi:glucan phosphoethanolaminetransferase (alkaline phosphatase superfamily)
MRKALNILDGFSASFLFFLIWIVLAFALFQDRLLFKTDPPNLIQFFLATSFLFACIWTLAFLPFHLRVGEIVHQRFLNGFSILLFGQILFGLCISAWSENVVFDYTVTQLSKSTTELSRLKSFLTLSTVIFLICWVLAFGIHRLNNYSQRINQLTRALFLTGFCYLVVFSVYQEITRVSGMFKPKKNLIFIVLDGLSTRYLSTYTPGEKTPGMDSVAAQSMVYTNIRTNHTHTFGYFNTIYSGHKSVDPDNTLPEPGLLHRLQEANLNTRWISYHNNGVPDARNQPYRGFRSAYLNGSMAWLLRFLNIDYNIFEVLTEGGRGRSMGYRQSAMNRWLVEARGQSFLNPLENSFIEEIENLRSGSRSFFVVNHLPPNAMTSKDRSPNLWEMEADHFIPKDRLEKIKRKILRETDYTYTKEDRGAVKVFENNYRNSVAGGTNSLERFIKVFKQRGWDKDTCLIITADHGKIFSKGKLAYGFHNDEEVARVPMYILCHGQTGVDPRLGESIDVAQTILDYFNIEQPLDPNARSLFSNKEQPYTTTLTTKSNKRREWFLNVYINGFKFVFNVYPGHLRVQKEQFLNFFDTEIVSRGPDALKSFDIDLDQILRDYRIEDVSLEDFTKTR